MEYSFNIASCLYDIHKIFARDIYRARNYKQSLDIDIHNHSPPTLNIQGEPQCNVSEEQRLLDDDIEARKRLSTNQKDLHETRDEYKWFKPTIFRCHIEQYTRNAKYNKTLKVKSDSKLKKKMVKYYLGDVDVD